MVVSRHARVGIVGDPAQATEAWLLLHGHGMLARGMLHWFRPAAAPHRLLVAPEALSRFYVQLSGAKRAVGASWVTREDFDHDRDDVFQYIERAVREVVPASIPLDIHGFSQGVSVGTRWAIGTSRPVRQIVCWAGAIPDDVTGAGLRASISHEVLDLVVGDQDDRVPPERVVADGQRLRAEGMPTMVHRFAGGHTVDPGLLAEFAGTAAPAE
jgi:predicted esterase